ncbi:hypothetical protein AZ46_0216245 [Metabacillus indicus LMG 22858]|uniref:Uncharacterized protein n=1 Tax=Metabacillus indicus TaxID=246786 RepID=A0A084GKJ6_METID|nr:hypothetical protein GS18_0217880 [Metabacillus indicus]KEZ48472.1 hypothetical protein AZ46_0216245 [Metabacillus indicus LMG 22858]
MVALISEFGTIKCGNFIFEGTYLWVRNHQTEEYPFWWHLSLSSEPSNRGITFLVALIAGFGTIKRRNNIFGGTYRRVRNHQTE